jgi:uncharacterized protein
VPIGGLRRTPGARQQVARAGAVGRLAVVGSMVPAEATVHVDAVIEAVGGGVVVTGTVSSPWEGECRRCLGPVRGTLEVAVREIYERPTRAADDPALAGEPETDEMTYRLGVDTLDLLPMVRDALVLDLPLAPLCRPDCAGLCPTCGTDRNVGPCGCVEEVIAPGWAALDALRSPDSS